MGLLGIFVVLSAFYGFFGGCVAQASMFTDYLNSHDNECAAINSYPRSSAALALAGGPVNPFCQNQWHVLNNSPQALNVCSTFQDRFVATPLHYSRSQMNKIGYIPVNIPNSSLRLESFRLQQAKQIMDNAKDAEVEVSLKCCVDNNLCRETLKKVKIKFCQPPTDPDAPDSCVNNSNFAFTDQEREILWRRLDHRYNQDFHFMHNEDFEEIRKIL